MSFANGSHRICASAFLLGAAAGAGAQETYKFINVVSDAGRTQAYAINASGQTVGWAQLDEEVAHAHYWFNGATTDLDDVVHFLLKHPYFGVDYHQAFDISNGGQVVGTARLEVACTPDDIIVTNAFILMPAVLSDFASPFPGDALVNLRTFENLCEAHDSAAIAISNANHVVGWADFDSPGGTTHAFLVTPQNGLWYVDGDSNGVNDLIVDLGTLDGESAVSSATAVNDDGVVVGYSYTRTNTLNDQAAYHAFRVVPAGGVWSQDLDFDGTNDLMEDLGTLGGLNSWARAINNAGVVVGEAETAESYVHAFRWEGGVMTDLGTLGGNYSSAASINEDGVIVGWSENARGERRAVAWIDGQIYDLNARLLATDSPGMRLTEARDINENGVIVGWGDGDEPQAYMLRIATDAEIAEAEAIVNGDDSDDDDPVDSGGSDTDSDDGAGGGTTLVPADQLGEPTDATTDDGDAVAGEDIEASTGATGLCGAGAAGFLPLAIAGLALFPRRRR